MAISLKAQDGSKNLFDLNVLGEGAKKKIIEIAAQIADGTEQLTRQVAAGLRRQTEVDALGVAVAEAMLEAVNRVAVTNPFMTPVPQRSAQQQTLPAPQPTTAQQQTLPAPQPTTAQQTQQTRRPNSAQSRPNGAPQGGTPKTSRVRGVLNAALGRD